MTAVTYYSNSPTLTYIGLSSDTKPSGVPAGSLFWESDTGNQYIFAGGSTWFENKSLTASFPTQNAHTVFAGPTTGSAATPTFRTLVALDIPTALNGTNFGGFASSDTVQGVVEIKGSETSTSIQPVGLRVDLTITKSSNTNNTYGIRTAPTLNLTATTGTSTEAGGLLASPTISVAAGHTLSSAVGVSIGVAAGTVSGTITNGIGINLTAINVGTNRYGLFIGTISGGSTNFAIKTGTGQVSLGDNLTFGADNASDIGASGATRPRTGFFATGLVVGGGTSASTANGSIYATADTNAIALRFSGRSTDNAAQIFFSNNANNSNYARVLATSSDFQIGTLIANPLILQANGLEWMRITADGSNVHHNFTVAALPAVSTGGLAFVTDANATTRGSTVAGGGSNKLFVYSDGTNWLII